MYIHIKRWICLLTFSCFFCYSSVLNAQEYYVEYSPQSRSIYEDIIDLKLDSIPFKIDILKNTEPYNLASLHLENYLDFFTIFITEEKYEFEKRSKNKDIRISIIEDNLDDSNPYKRFMLAEINLQWALTRSKFNQLFKSSREVYKAYNLLTNNQELFPDFVYNKKSLSVLHSLVETITIANVFKSILGLEGSIELAKEEIEEVIRFGQNNPFMFAEEADAIKALILFYQANERESAWSFLKESSLDVKQSLLSVFLISKFAQRMGLNEMAITVLRDRPMHSSYSDFHYLDYQMGLSLLRKLDPNCKIYLLQFVDNFKGKHFVKEAYQKLAWASLVFEENFEQYKFYMKKVQSEGDDLVDDDKQALQESKSSKVPNILLLKSRLLFDGGYYKEALNLMTDHKHLFSDKKQFQAEYNYRKGRILQNLSQFDEARKYFDFLIKFHSKDKEFYACSAALQMGIIEEKLDNENIAEVYYKTCLKIKPKTYRRSLHQKAKSGLERILK